MMAVIGIVAPGAMGSAVARRISEHGARVLTLLDGRTAATCARAEAAGMVGSDLAGLVTSDVILSIVPPAEALPLALRVAAALKSTSLRPVYVDCNAIDVRTVEAVGAVITATGACFVDGGIIGTPPKPDTVGPTFYLSGHQAVDVGAILQPLGLAITTIAGPIGAASALKMSYAGITKGLAAIASIMVLGAERAGAGTALRAELQASQPQLLARFGTTLPDMVPKAYRWVAEMREIAGFLADDPAGAAAFDAIAAFYERIALDAVGHRAEVGVIERFSGMA